MHSVWLSRCAVMLSAIRIHGRRLCPGLQQPAAVQVVERVRRHQTSLQDADNPASQRAKKPAGLEGKNWRDLRKKQRLGHDRWEPVKRLTHDQMEHLRNLRDMKPEEWTNKKLSEVFGISVSSVVRILKSKFDAPPEVRARQDAKARQQRDERREQVYNQLANKTQEDRS